jgi:hypothetical protein
LYRLLVTNEKPTTSSDSSSSKETSIIQDTFESEDQPKSIGKSEDGPIVLSKSRRVHLDIPFTGFSLMFTDGLATKFNEKCITLRELITVSGKEY